ncbi:MAG: hypothetical protein FWD25_01035 [Clostridia bacterium]|nr:hypothetical protein [Clostridia bacterium]
MLFTEILQNAEWIMLEDGIYKRFLDGISYADSVKLGGQTLYNRGTPIPTKSSVGLYRNETFSVSGFMYGGTPYVFPKVGCRPSSRTQRGPTLWGTLNTQVTRYVNRFADGEVWVSTAINSRTGAQISSALTATTWPRGIRYLMVQLCGGGGAGGSGGLGVVYSNYGGQAAAGAVCIQLPEVGYATIVAGGGGSGVSGIGANGNSGRQSLVTVGSSSAWATGGGGGDGGIAKNPGSGGSWGYSGESAVLSLIVGSSGATGSMAPNSVAYTDPTPEATYHVTEGSGGGGNRGGTGYGAGGNGMQGFVKLFY